MLPPDACKTDDDELDTVIVVKRPDSLTRKSGSRNKSDSPSKKRRTSGGKGSKRSCRCQHGDRARQRHNATQTPDSILSCSQLLSCHRHSTALDCCDSQKNCSKNHCGLMNSELKTGEITCHCHITHHCHRYSPVSGGSGAGLCSGDGKDNTKKSCEHGRHSHQHRHSYQHRQHLHNQQHHHHHHHNYRHLQAELQRANAKFNIRQLPGYNSKSSYDSSDDLQQSDLDAVQQERLQEIAIEIDAATMTEGNTSTATSNFAYKMAMGNVTAAPIIMAPLHDPSENGGRHRVPKHSRRRHCDSMNSNSTVETDELSRSHRAERDDEEGKNTNTLIEGSNKNAHHTIWGSRDINDLYNRTEMTKTDNRRTEDIKTPQHLICCDDSMCCITSTRDKRTSAAAHNECVKIQRKLFKASAADDCCSTCSHCTNCSCLNADATSCSSFDDLDADEDYEQRQMATHELVVSAECHRCNFHRRSTSSTGEEEADEEREEEEIDGDLNKNEKLTLKTSRPKNNNTINDSSAHTSRRSSASYCSCHSSTCYCCECNCRSGDEEDDNADAGDDDCDTATTGQMRTARDTSFTPLTSAATADFDAELSSTLTPLTTNASSVATTPGAEEADITLRSLNNTLTEDVGSSLSQSAEYFSLSSNNPQSQMSPAHTPVRRSHKLHSEGGASACTMADNSRNCNEDAVLSTSATRKPCKHYIKHHRHKRSTSPLDGYL